MQTGGSEAKNWDMEKHGRAWKQYLYISTHEKYYVLTNAFPEKLQIPYPLILTAPPLQSWSSACLQDTIHAALLRLGTCNWIQGIFA